MGFVLPSVRSFVPYAVKPWSIQLEVVEGCNYSCWFCGIHSIREKTNWEDYRMMDPDMVARAFDETARWLPRIRVELNNHGEPTLHPAFVDVISAVKRDPNAQVQLQTNGSMIESWDEFEEKVTRWFETGMNILAINAYKRWWGTPNPAYASRYEMFMAYAQRYGAMHRDVKLVDHYYDNPQHLSIYHYYGPRKKFLFVLDDLGEVNLKLRAASGRPVSKDLMNEAGNSPAKPMEKLLHRPVLTEPLQKKCTRVFRELTIGWNGVVPLCCYDWKSQIVFGKFPDQSLKHIWESKTWNAVRELLFRKNRHMTPCSVCDYNGGWRQGLIKRPEGFVETPDVVLQKLVADHMQLYKKEVHPNGDVVIGPYAVAVHGLVQLQKGKTHV